MAFLTSLPQLYSPWNSNVIALWKSVWRFKTQILAVYSKASYIGNVYSLPMDRLPWIEMQESGQQTDEELQWTVPLWTSYRDSHDQLKLWCPLGEPCLALSVCTHIGRLLTLPCGVFSSMLVHVLFLYIISCSDFLLNLFLMILHGVWFSCL